MKDLQRNQAIKFRLEDPNWSKKMTDKVLQSQIANQENSLSHNILNKKYPMKLSIAALIFFGLAMGLELFQIETDKKPNSIASENLASIDTAMLGDIYWENDDWGEDLDILKKYEY